METTRQIYRNGKHMGNIRFESNKLTEEEYTDLINYTVLRDYNPPIKEEEIIKNESLLKKIKNIFYEQHRKI